MSIIKRVRIKSYNEYMLLSSMVSDLDGWHFMLSGGADDGNFGDFFYSKEKPTREHFESEMSYMGFSNERMKTILSAPTAFAN